MIFKRIELNNLFSYCGTRAVDLRGIEKARNIAVISGRNGFGKTNFINALKILFGGISDELLTSAGLNRKLSLKAYILGQGEDWFGILNRRAAALGEKNCWIKAIWTEKSGRVNAERSWIIANGGYETKLIIKSEFLPTPLENQEAQAFLDDRLPKTYLPFYFFDGDNIRYIAEANQKQQTKQIEQILNITPIEILKEYLNKVRNNWKQDAMPEKEKAGYEKLKSEQREIKADIRANLEQQHLAKEEIEEIQKKIKANDRYLKSLRAYKSQQDTTVLETREKNLLNSIEETQISLSEKLPVDAPLLANKNLGIKVIREIDFCLEKAPFPPKIRNKLKQLPLDVFSGPPYPEPPLSNEQLEFYRQRLKRLLNDFLPVNVSMESFLLSGIDVAELEHLKNLMRSYVEAEQLRQDTAKQLKKLRREKGELENIRKQMGEASSLSKEEKRKYEQIEEENKEQQESLVNLKTSLNALAMVKRRLETRKKELEKNISVQLERVGLSADAKNKYGLAKELIDLFDQYKSRLKVHYKKKIEDSLNRHFPELMTSHQMVDRIEVDEDFGLHYLDQKGKPLSMGSFSQGMKQLAAISLLWALKEVSNKPVPVVVDTPLARIDSEHQRNLLQKYFPKAAQQVILLPTDSELDRAKYSLLCQYIYKEYRLENNGGDNSEFLEEPMFTD